MNDMHAPKRVRDAAGWGTWGAGFAHAVAKALAAAVPTALPTAFAASLLLSGCSNLLPKPTAAPARHVLDAGQQPALAAPGASPALPASPDSPDSPVLTVTAPRAAPGHESRRMVYVKQPGQLQAFAFHEWAEPPAQLLAPLLVQALLDQGGFRAVLQAPTAAGGGWLLETELLRLQQDFSTEPSQVRLSLRAVLLDGSTRQVLAQRTFDAQVAAARGDPVAGVQASQLAAQQVLKALAVFCADTRRRGTPLSATPAISATSATSAALAAGRAPTSAGGAGSAP
jgi:cholesterol transport system auxiliary component